MLNKDVRAKGIQAALGSAVFLGLAPIFGKQAIEIGFSPYAVVALRTSIAAILFLLIVAIFKRQFLFIFPVGLAGCILAGVINGLGSILYYVALSRIDASVGQLLYSLYPLFVAVWLLFDSERPGKLTLVRLALAFIAAIFLIVGGGKSVDTIGALLMLGSAALYALHLPINQRVLYEVPAPTVTLYTLLAMSAVVVPAYFLTDLQWNTGEAIWWPIAALTLVTFLSRITLFLGVKHLGGMQTALLGLGELLITVSLGILWLNESLNVYQWVGAVLLGFSLLLVYFEKTPPKKIRGKSGWLSWLRPPKAPANLPWGMRD